MDKKLLEPILKVISNEFFRVLGDQVNRILLYSSYARGEAKPDFDLDILVVINGEVGYPALIRQTSELVSRISLENELVISRVFTSKARFETECSPFMINVRQEGIDI